MADAAPVETGIFLLSLDTELAWGYFDHPRHVRDRIFSSDGSRERRAVHRLLALFKEYEISATWSVVGHMVHAAWEQDASDPVLAWKGLHDSYEQIYGTEHPLWYGEDIVDAILAGEPRQEIGIHGYSHRPLGDDDVSGEAFKEELTAWQRLAERKGIRGQSMTFPRNRIGHLHLLKGLGVRSYRGRTRLPRIAAVPLLGKLFNRLEMYMQIYPPRTHPIPQASAEPLNLEASYWLFGMKRHLELRLDALGIPLARIHRVRAAVKRAAQRGEVFHLWAHPWEFRTDDDFAKLIYVLDEVRTQRALGRMRSLTMTELTDMVCARREGGGPE